MPDTPEPRETLAPGPVPDCPFCAIGELEAPLTETASFYAVGDHAPLLGGHILIVPKAHYACYGALPATLDADFLALKDTICRFLTEVYRAPTFFEHGVFRQTVYHAHLHAMPFGSANVGLEAMAVASGGQPLRSLDDLRAWYATRGHYFTLETPGDPENGVVSQSAIFPPEMGVYGRALTTIRQLTNAREGWSPPQLRHATRGPKLRALTQAWQAWRAQGE